MKSGTPIFMTPGLRGYFYHKKGCVMPLGFASKATAVGSLKFYLYFMIYGIFPLMFALKHIPTIYTY